MESSIFKFIWRYSGKQQLALLAMTVVSFPFLYLSLDLPKIIINQAIGGSDFPRELFGVELDQIKYLMVLCGIFLVLVLINGGFKYVVNVYRGIVGERMLRRLRYTLFKHVLRFPLPYFRKISQGEIVSMITAETEPLGGFVSDAVSLPAFQGGTLLTILVFMFVQDWVLGVAAISLYPLQAYLIPKLQRKVNALKKERVVKIRKLSESIGEVVSSVQEVHAHDTSQFELAHYSDRMDELYGIRYRIFLLKFFIKFLNNFLAQLTPFFFFSIGGYLVINGELTFGALVAVLAAYKDLSSPWKELLNYYQVKEDARIKYELLADTFQPADLLDESSQAEDPAKDLSLSGEVVASNLSLREVDDDESGFASGASFRFKLQQRVAVIGQSGSGKGRLAALMAGLDRPLSGSISIGGHRVDELPQTVTGRRIAYVGLEPRMRGGTVRDNLYYSLKHRPVIAAEYVGEERADVDKRLREAALAGNSLYDSGADWVDYETAGASGPADLAGRAIEALTCADMDEDIYEFGLRGTVDPETRGELAGKLLLARAELKHRLEDAEIAPLVELFDRERYNTNMTVAENLMFGSPRDPAFAPDNLAANPYLRKVLTDTNIYNDLLGDGRELAELMLDLFADVAPESELFEQYSFISADDLPAFRSLLGRTQAGRLNELSEDDQTMLLSLPLKLAPARHRLGLIDGGMQARLLDARRVFAEGFADGDHSIEFFDGDHYNPAASVQDNILFGRLAYGKARSEAQIGRLIREVIEKLDLRDAVMELGLDYAVGIGGARLGPAQRQKLAIARSLLKRPDLIVLDQATAALDAKSQETIMRNLFEDANGPGLIWVVHHASLAQRFDHTLVLEGGRIAEQGRFDELNERAGVLNELVAAAG